MAEIENITPPVGEEIHLPGPTIVPLVLAAGLAVFLIGLTTSVVVLVIGALVLVGAIVSMIADARHEFSGLPPEHHR